MCSSNITVFDALTAVDDISFKIHEGNIVGILGQNGAGKTTKIRLITGIFELKGKSRVQIYLKDLTSNPKQSKKNFGIVPEVSNAYTDYTVWQNLFFSGIIYGLSKEKMKECARILLDRFETYEGNVPDVSHFKQALVLMERRFNAIGIDLPQIILIFDKGNNSKGAYKFLDAKGIHFVSSIRPSMNVSKPLLEVPLANYEVFWTKENGKKVLGYRTTMTVYIGKDK